MGGTRPSLNPAVVEKLPDVYIPMGNTAENVARKFEIGREEQDAFAYESHRKALAAWTRGDFLGRGRAGQDARVRGRRLARRHLRSRRGPPRRHVAGKTGGVETRVRSDWIGHRGQLVAAHRRRRGGRPDGGRQSRRAGQEDPRLLPCLRRGRRAPRRSWASVPSPRCASC